MAFFSMCLFTFRKQRGKALECLVECQSESSWAALNLQGSLKSDADLQSDTNLIPLGPTRENNKDQNLELGFWGSSDDNHTNFGVWSFRRSNLQSKHWSQISVLSPPPPEPYQHPASTPHF